MPLSRAGIAARSQRRLQEITGRVVFSGAAWYRRDFRGKDLATILPRISRAYAFTRWNSDFTIGMMDDAVVAGGMAERVGHTNVSITASNWWRRRSARCVAR